jgi:hypothetical protein
MYNIQYSTTVMKRIGCTFDEENLNHGAFFKRQKAKNKIRTGRNWFIIFLKASNFPFTQLPFTSLPLYCKRDNRSITLYCIVLSTGYRSITLTAYIERKPRLP